MNISESFIDAVKDIFTKDNSVELEKHRLDLVRADQQRHRDMATNPNATQADLDKALSHDAWHVRAMAANHPNLNKYQLDKALGDVIHYVRDNAKKNPAYNKFYQ